MTISTNVINMYKQATLLCTDIETKDPLLTTHGPGTHRGDGHICGVGFACDNQGRKQRSYLSLTHPDTSQEDRDTNRRIITDIVSQPNDKIGANIAYDAEWLSHENMPIAGKLHDVQFAEPLLDEYKRSYSLDSLAQTYGLQRKASNMLDDYANHMGWPVTKKGNGIKHIWRMPTKVARDYTFVDVELPLDIWQKQKRLLQKQNLYDLYEIETDLIPVMLEMRKNGVRLDVPLLKRTTMQVLDIHYNLKQELYKYAGYELNTNSTKQLAELFDKKGIPYPRHPRTEKMKEKGVLRGNPNLNKRVLQHLALRHPICKTLLDFRHYETLLNMFLHKYANFMVGDRLYASFHPLRNDEYGTVSGRFSSSKPNLQQVSAKKEDHDEEEDLSVLKGQIVRQLFIPDEGYDEWAKADYSQIEYRITAHYASGEGSEELRQSYIQNKEMDYHQRVMDITGFDRREAKNVNFGGLYGIGAKTASTLFGWTLEEAEEILTAYHKAAPYVRSTRYAVSDVVARRGYLFTILGRKARVHSSRKIYSMFNRLIQGSAADVMKKAMVDCYKKGVFNILKLHITVHDELDVSKKNTKEHEDALKEMIHTMEETVKFDVPILVDCHKGKNWAEAD